MATIQTAVIVYGLQKHYQTFSRSWIVVTGIFNLLKSKLKRSEKVEEKKEKEKEKNIPLKTRKSSLKRFGQMQ